MAKYRAHGPIYLNGRSIAPGEAFEGGARPGADWEPLDDDAWREFHAWQAERRRLRMPDIRYKFAVKPAEEIAPAAASPAAVTVTAASKGGAIDIPEDWRSLKAIQRIALAKKLGAPNGTKAVEADALIEAELAKRA